MNRFISTTLGLVLAMSAISHQIGVNGVNLPSNVRQLWRVDDGGNCQSVDLSELNSNGKGLMEVCLQECIDTTAGEVKSLGDDWFCIRGNSSVPFYINAEEKQGTVEFDQFECSDDVPGSVQSAEVGKSCGTFRTAMATFGSMGILTALVILSNSKGASVNPL